VRNDISCFDSYKADTNDGELNSENASTISDTGRFSVRIVWTSPDKSDSILTLFMLTPYGYK
jgi:hypothetical protein